MCALTSKMSFLCGALEHKENSQRRAAAKGLVTGCGELWMVSEISAHREQAERLP